MSHLMPSELPSTLFGLKVIVSPSIPEPGWYDKLGADHIRRANREVLAHGGSLTECAKPTYYATGVMLVNGRELYLHPSMHRRLLMSYLNVA